MLAPVVKIKEWPQAKEIPMLTPVEKIKENPQGQRAPHANAGGWGVECRGLGVSNAWRAVVSNAGECLSWLSWLSWLIAGWAG